MSLLASLHPELRSSWSGPYALKDPALAHLWGSGRRTDSGITVTDELAMMCSAVFSAVNLLSSDIAKAPLNLHKRLPDGGSEHYTKSKVYYLLKTEANPETGAMVFRQTLQAHALTLGGGYAEIVRDGFGRPSALEQITPDRICAKRTKTGTLFYLVDQKDEFDPFDIFHLHGLGYDGTSGYALINQARQAVGLALAMEKFSAAFFGNGSTFGGVLSTDAPLADEEEKTLIREQIEKMHGGLERAFKIMVLGQGYKFEPFGTSAKDSDLSALRDKQVEEVSRFYRIPLHKLNNLTRATFSNVEQQDLEYYKGPILDWMTLWEQEAHRKLIPKLERQLFFFKHNANVFLRGDMAARSAAFGVFRDKGIFNANEIRELEDMGPQPGEQGNTYFMQAAQMPQDKLLEKAEADIEKVKAEIEQIQHPPTPVPASTTTDEADDAEMMSLRARLADAEGIADQWRTTAAEASEARASAVAAKDAADREVDVRRQAEAEKQTALDAVRAELAQAGLVTAEQRQHLDAAKAELAAATEALREAMAARASVAGDVHAATERATTLAAQSEAAAVIVASLTAERDALTAAAEDLRTQLSKKDREIAEAETRARLAAEARETVEAHVAAATAELAEVREQLDVARRAVHTQAAAQQARELDAHRSLYLHVMRGAIERETDRARRAQQTPEKLRAWIESWYDGHAELMRARLLPAVMIHLAWIGSDEDAGELVGGFVAEHVATSRRQLAAVVQGEAEDLAGSLAGLLHRWDTERIHTIPAKLMEREVAYVRSRQ